MTVNAAYLRARWPDKFSDATVFSDFSLTEAINAATGQVNLVAYGSSANEAVALLSAAIALEGGGAEADGVVQGGAGQVSASFARDPATGARLNGFRAAFNQLTRRKVVGIALVGGC